MRNAVSNFIATIYFSTCIAINISAQTLVKYDDKTISKEDFLKAYHKNNTGEKPTEKSYRDYLELYTRYKLKVKAAYDLKLDTLPNQAAELQNFRSQIVETYMTDEASLNKLVNEVFTRSQNDIHLAHIFIAAPKTASPADTLKAFKKATEAYTALKKGKGFAEAAIEYSEDPFAKSNRGDIGYITVFSLPYELETLAYSTAPGQFSKIYRSKAGYHILKNSGEKKAGGKIRAAQILLAFPPNASEAAKSGVKHIADSIYNVLIKGADFNELARKVSGDNLTYQTGGEMPEFGIGKYDAGFETAAFALSKDGEISQPVVSAFGYHIIKRLGAKPVSTVKNKETLDALKQQVMNDPRIEISKKAMLQKILHLTDSKRTVVNENNLWVYTDSFLQNKSLPKFPGLDNKTILSSFTKKDITVKDWLDYRRSIKDIASSTTGKTNKELLDQYLQTAAFDYYRNHAEDYNKEFAYQLNEFKEGNLLFEIMQRRVWDKASSDSLGLQNYYESHKNKYWWESSADAIIFTCSNEKAAEDVTARLQNNIENWKKLVDTSNGSAQADSGRFELAQLPAMEQGGLKPGRFTSFVKNQTDNTVTFAYILKIYNERSPRSYKDARGFVINDYQAFLEDQWIAELKKKYPVTVNEEVFKSLLK